MSYVYVLTRLNSPESTSKQGYRWTEDVAEWITSMKEIKDMLDNLYPTAKDQWEQRTANTQDNVVENYLWGQIPIGERFEFTIHLLPFPWLSVQTSNTEEVIRIAKLMRLSVLDVQTGDWIYIQRP